MALWLLELLFRIKACIYLIFAKKIWQNYFQIFIKFQGEWYSREKNLDTVTVIDASIMSRRGTCIEHETDFSGTYTFLFAQNPQDRSSCYHCVRVFVRTVNIIEKRECRYNSLCKMWLPWPPLLFVLQLAVST